MSGSPAVCFLAAGAFFFLWEALGEGEAEGEALADGVTRCAAAAMAFAEPEPALPWESSLESL